MPIAKKIIKSFADYYDNTDTNVYDDYGDDFEADSDKDSSLNGGRGDKTTNTKESKFYDREHTNSTEKSALFQKRKEQNFGSVGNYRDNSRGTQSESRTPKQKGPSRATEKTRYLAGSKMKKGGSYSSSKPRSDGVVVRRVLSANRNKVNSLQNLILELQTENEQLRLENRDLKRSSRIQEKVIKKYDNEEAEISLLIQKHSSELRFLKEKLKKQKEGNERSTEEIHRKDLEIQKLRDKLRRCEELIKDRQLDEREKLQQKLSRLEQDLYEKEMKISELERVVKLSEKSRVREAKEKNEKYRKAVEELKRLESTQRELKYRFKEKEKELEVQNIYSQRIALKKKMQKPQSQQGSYSAGGFTSSRLSKPPSPLIMDVSETSRERTDDGIDSSFVGNQVESNKVAESSQVETMVSALKKKEEELEKMLVEERKRIQLEEDQRKLKEMEEKIRMKEEEIRRAEREREDRRRAEERIKEVEEIEKMKLDAEKELNERKFLETIGQEKEKNLKEIERLEIQVASNGEQESSRSEAEKKALRNFQAGFSEKRMLLNDNSDRRDSAEKKELLLARMKAIDANEKSENSGELDLNDYYGTSTITGSGKSVSKTKTKPIFLESSREDDDLIKHAPLDFRSNDGKRRGSKEYNYKRTVGNSLLTSEPDSSGETNRGSKKGDDDVLYGDYAPSVNSTGRKRASRFRNQGKKDDEKEDFLFFDTKNFTNKEEVQSIQESKADNDIFTTSKKQTKSSPDKDKNIAPSNKNNKNKTKPDQDSSSPLFGAYQPTFGNESIGAKADPLSPEDDLFAEDRPKYGRRGKVQKPASGGGLFESGLGSTRAGISNFFGDAEKKVDHFGTSAVNAISNFGDDDIEEVVLT